MDVATIVLIVTVLVTIVVAGLIQRPLGWLPGVAALIVVAVLGGLVGKFLPPRAG